MATDIETYNHSLSQTDLPIVERLQALIESGLPEAQGKVWHGHPVWFIEKNPVVGYHRQKDSVRVLFWSGQSFATDALIALGSFKAASLAVPTLEGLDAEAFASLLEQARVIQWDYANLRTNKGLVKLTEVF